MENIATEIQQGTTITLKTLEFQCFAKGKSADRFCYGLNVRFYNYLTNHNCPQLHVKKLEEKVNSRLKGEN